MAKVTIYDVAALAGVSIATVSQALNRPERVRAETRTKVLAAVEELDFIPQASAVSHARRGVGRIGVLAPFTSYESYRRRLSGVLSECEGQAREVVVYDHESAAATSSPLLHSLPSTGKLDGLLLMGLPLDDSLVQRLLRQEIPTVIVDSHRPEFSSVNTRDEEGGVLVAQHLLARGHSTFAFVGEAQHSHAYLSQGQRRRSGFANAISEAGVHADKLIDVAVDGGVAGGRDAFRLLEAAGTLPSAVFAHNDSIAAGLLLELRSRGVEVPREVAVIGFDDGDIAEAVGLTTVRQPFEESGRVAARLLAAVIARESDTIQRIELELQLVVRETA